MKKTKHFFIIVLSILSGVSFGIALSTFLLTSGYLTSGYRAFVIQSGSMQPTIKTGSLVITKTENTYQVGDIVTFEKNKRVITHRITAIDNIRNQFTTKGDANEEADLGTITHSQIIGKRTLAIPYIGYISAFVRTPHGFVLFVVVPATIIVYEELKKIIKEIKNFFIKNEKQSTTGPRALFVFIPLLICTIFVGSALSYFSDRENSSGNVLSAASDFGNNSIESIVIHRVLPTSSCYSGNAQAQFIELYNNGNTTVNLKNYKFTDGVNTVDTIHPNAYDLAPGEFVLLSHNNSIWKKCHDDKGIDTINLGGNLNINTGVLYLLNKDETVIDALLWGTNTLSPTVDQSLMRISPGFDTASGADFNESDFLLN